MAAIGEYETVLPFQAIGVKPFFVNDENSQTFPEMLLKLAKERYAVVFIQEKLFVDFRDKVNEINEEYPVSVIPIPGIKGSMGTGVETIKNSVERAVGMDIFSVK
ncbi:MAG: V-type ATP synthase subunit F [Synergistales bacterium]|nr:V-type ATP synthase subunit F [Synergistales bacterium]